jgi:thioredoxin reductase (NADPH)
MDNKEIWDLIIIGAGPAGLTAGIYARRANLKTMVIECSAPGGKILKTAEIENWPGHKHVTGPDLAFSMFDHATSLNLVYQSGKVIDIKDGAIKEIITENDGVFYAKTIIIATGTLERTLGIPNELKYTGKGVSYCAICDGAFFNNKVISVVGGGNSALEEALYLTNFATKVNIIIRRDVFRADPLVQEEVMNHPKINVITKHIPIEVVGSDVVTGLVVENVDTKVQNTIATDGIFPFIGLDPITSFVKSLKITDDLGYIITNKNLETDKQGIYAAGDVVAKELRQIVTATNDGAVAAQQAIKYLEHL